MPYCELRILRPRRELHFVEFLLRSDDSFDGVVRAENRDDSDAFAAARLNAYLYRRNVKSLFGADSQPAFASFLRVHLTRTVVPP